MEKNKLQYGYSRNWNDYHQTDQEGPNWEVGVPGYDGYAYAQHEYNYRIAVGTQV